MGCCNSHGDSAKHGASSECCKAGTSKKCPIKCLLCSCHGGWAALIMRVGLGVVMFPHGAQKMLGWYGGYGFSATIDAFTNKMGLPYIVALLVILGEFLGSIGLIVGCLTRFAAFGMAVIMLGAIFTVHLDNGFFMNWFGTQSGEGYEYHILAIALSVGLIFLGSGKWSIDSMLCCRGSNKCCK